jgi:RNA polymerase sigma factor (sigma-70 family)
MRARLARSRETPKASDADIMARLARGEIGALGELYDRHRAAVDRFIVRVIGDAEDVDDLVHVTFLAAAKSAERYDGRASCRPWLIGIAAQMIRRRRTAFGRFLDVIVARFGQRATSVDPRVALEARTDIAKALARLTEAKRLTLVMAEVEGMSCEEIAAATAVPIGTVWTRLHAARKEMRAALEESS